MTPETFRQQMPGSQQAQGGYLPQALPEGDRNHASVTRYADLVAALGWALFSFGTLYWISGFIFDSAAEWWIVLLVWLSSGIALLFRPFEDFLAKVAFRLRRPTQAEEARLRPIWHRVAVRSEVLDRQFAIWIHDSPDITAPPTTGHTIAVTHWALYTLPPSHLEAVLAHELMHHLRGRLWLSLLGFWYSLPARAVLGVFRLMGRIFRAVPAIGCLVVGTVFLMYLGVFISMLLFRESFLPLFVYSLLFLAIPLMAWLGRWTEREADRAAAELGYGPKLLEVFYGWQVSDSRAHQAVGTRRKELLSSRPRVSERIRALEKLLHPR